MWATFKELNVPQTRTINLAGSFIGTGWGAAGRNATQAWRWLGHHGGGATLFVSLPSGRSHYEAELVVHTAANMEALQGISVTVNGQKPPAQRLEQPDGLYLFKFTIPEETVGASGKARIAITTKTGGAKGPVLAMSEARFTCDADAVAPRPSHRRSLAHLASILLRR